MAGLGLDRVVAPAGVLPQAAWQLDPDSALRADEVAIRVRRLNLDAASYRQLADEHLGDGPAIRDAVLGIIRSRGKMHNPVTGSGGMLLGTVEEVGPDSTLGLIPGQSVATLVSLTLTPLRIEDALQNWDGNGEQVPCEGRAILFGRSIAAVLPEDLPEGIALSVFDVCGAPALVTRVVRATDARSVCVLGAAGKSGSLSLAAARRAGATRLVGLVPTDSEASRLRTAGLADEVVLADARDPLAVSAVVGEPVQVSVVCVDVPGCEHAAILATAAGGTVIFFSMATSFAGAALGAEGMAADVTMLVGNGYTPGHADLALDLYRSSPGVAQLFTARGQA
ncbi:MAG: L-erythro-3,5-diaminohexanoate dehydrogenase [Actinomycetota bacterium]|nr:L-erythro-3,5-diaminohexanoate dehydrogenase [Actinomycetota bacterium]